jgi:hypothetical protein
LPTIARSLFGLDIAAYFRHGLGHSPSALAASTIGPVSEPDAAENGQLLRDHGKLFLNKQRAFSLPARIPGPLQNSGSSAGTQNGRDSARLGIRVLVSGTCRVLEAACPKRPAVSGSGQSTAPVTNKRVKSLFPRFLGGGGGGSSHLLPQPRSTGYSLRTKESATLVSGRQ